MQVLFAWKSEGITGVEASQRWTELVDSWRKTYQQLVERELHFEDVQTGSLFLGLLYLPEMFRQWQEFYRDESSAIAWLGIAHNLREHLSPHDIDRMNTGFLSRFGESGDRFLRELDGHFAVSVLDRTERRLRILMNTYGYVQCFWTSGPYGIAVGNRIAPLLDLAGRTPVPYRPGVVRMFAVGMNFGADTPYEGVFRLEPGEEALLCEGASEIQTRCHTPFSWILDKRKEFGDEYLQAGSESFSTTITQQLRHSNTSLMNLTGGMDSRNVVATAVSLGARPACDVSGLPEWREVTIASQVAEHLGVELHRLYPGEHYAEDLENTLRLWTFWTEGMISAATAFSRSVFSLCPAMRKFYAPYTQRFSGLAGELGRTASWGTELLLETPSPEEVYTRLRPIYRNEYLSKDDHALVHETIRANIFEGSRLGLEGHQLFNYFLWNEMARRGGGAILDMQQLGRYVFAPFNHPTLTAVFFSMTVQEHLAGAWHLYHLRRVDPTLLEIPFLKPPLWTADTASSRQFKQQQKLFRLHPALYRTLKHVKDSLASKYGVRMLNQDEEKAGRYFHAYLEGLLFSGQEWWPSIIEYKQGQRMWKRFLDHQETHPLWALASLELWGKQFFK